MHHVRLVLRASASAALLLPGWGGAACLAQGGGGGSIGNDDKSVSGTRNIEPERPSCGGGSISRFDGGCTFIMMGCSPGTVAGAVAGSGLGVPNRGGSVCAGAGRCAPSLRRTASRTVAPGHLSASGGGGVFLRSDGCAGRWTAMKR